MQLPKELDVKKIRAKASRSVLKSPRKTKLSDAPSSDDYQFDDLLQGKTQKVCNILIKENNQGDREPILKLHLGPLEHINPAEDVKYGTPDNQDIIGNSSFKPASSTNRFDNNSQSRMKLMSPPDSQASSPARINREGSTSSKRVEFEMDQLLDEDDKVS